MTRSAPSSASIRARRTPSESRGRSRHLSRTVARVLFPFGGIFRHGDTSINICAAGEDWVPRVTRPSATICERGHVYERRRRVRASANGTGGLLLVTRQWGPARDSPYWRLSSAIRSSIGRINDEQSPLARNHFALNLLEHAVRSPYIS